MLLFSIIILSLLGCYCYYLWETYSYWRRKGVVGPTPWPIVGNYGQVLFRLKSEKQLIRELYDQYPDKKFIGIFVGRTPALILKDPEMLKQVFAKDFKSFPNRLVSTAFDQFNKSIFVSPGNEDWYKLRKKFTTLSNNNLLNRVVDSVETASRNYFDYVEGLAWKTTKQNITEFYENLLFVISSEALLGTKEYSRYDKKSKLQTRTLFLAKLETLEARFCIEQIFPYVIIFFKFIIVPVTGLIFSYNFGKISAALKGRKQRNEMCSYSDLMLELQNKDNDMIIDDESINLHLVAVMSGILVPTSSAASYMCYEFAQKQDMQNKCYKEISQVMQKYNGNLSVEALSEMKYLEMVLEETFRRYGNLFVINRLCVKRYRFDDTNLEIDPGVIIIAPANALREDPKYFAEPEKFIPERFAPENKKNIPASVILTFGYGLRNCIGKPMAKLILTMTMAMLLSRFKIEPSDSTPKQVTYDSRFFTRSPKVDEFWMNVIIRK